MIIQTLSIRIYIKLETMDTLCSDYNSDHRKITNTQRIKLPNLLISTELHLKINLKFHLLHSSHPLRCVPIILRIMSHCNVKSSQYELKTSLFALSYNWHAQTLTLHPRVNFQTIARATNIPIFKTPLGTRVPFLEVIKTYEKARWGSNEQLLINSDARIRGGDGMQSFRMSRCTHYNNQGPGQANV